MEVWGGNQCVDSSCTMAGLDAWVYSRAYANATAGGDVYYVSSCATGRITRLLVADVSGHGAAVQQVAVGLRTLMRKFVNFIDQTRFVQSMNGQFAELSKTGNFATAVVTTFFAPTNRLSLCNAGHPPPLIYHAGRRTLALPGARRQRGREPVEPAVRHPRLVDYDQYDVDLQLGDLVMCYTDSLPSRTSRAAARCSARRVAPGAGGGGGERPGHVRAAAAGPDCRPARRQPDERRRDGPPVPAERLGPDEATEGKVLVPFRVARAILGSIGRKEEPAPWPELSVANVGGAVVPGLGRAERAEPHGPLRSVRPAEPEAGRDRPAAAATYSPFDVGVPAPIGLVIFQSRASRVM
jgi:hypothetical protein